MNATKNFLTFLLEIRCLLRFLFELPSWKIPLGIPKHILIKNFSKLISSMALWVDLIL